ncbi:MerR family DNA-binding protein [Ferrimonas balearica]|uniref:MerR family DNA-binding protein n=1 Tax=Ferrimonas balearica TaxID=44012 RepID=UPI001C99C81F|nr:MerR family DNA-binding protein [Ferrimonas balearica]MBY5923370.1 MerR family DNA-binding protein [Ferrimonas balearica]MBY5995328.1 MerR family DNA-binding protein [Ferrimonas balearica]
MKIGQVARETGLSVKAIRYYHDIGLVVAQRGDNGYRAYSAAQLEQLRFVARSKALGFSLEQCAELLSLQSRSDRTAAQVKALAMDQLSLVREKIAQLQALEARLNGLVSQCHGGNTPECPILDSLCGDLDKTAKAPCCKE